MDTKDQEEIYQLYENFRDIESTQPSINLDAQHPNNYSPDFLWAGMTDPTKSKQTYTPTEQEEGESKFEYKDKRGNVLILIRVVDGVAHLINKRSEAKIKIPLSRLKELKEI
jgi:hypothetical protein